MGWQNRNGLDRLITQLVILLDKALAAPAV
jgi:hypothetical protein